MIGIFDALLLPDGYNPSGNNFLLLIIADSTPFMQLILNIYPCAKQS